MARWQLRRPVPTQFWSIQHGVCCRNNGQGILRCVDWRGETNQRRLYYGYFWWNHEEAAATTRVPWLHVREQTSQLSGVPKRIGKGFSMGFIAIWFFYPNRKYIVNTNSFYIELTCKAASIFKVEFRDKRKATAKYLSSIGGEKSMNKVEKEEKKAGKVVSAINSVS